MIPSLAGYCRFDRDVAEQIAEYYAKLSTLSLIFLMHAKNRQSFVGCYPTRARAAFDGKARGRNPSAETEMRAAARKTNFFRKTNLYFMILYYTIKIFK